MLMEAHIEVLRLGFSLRALHVNFWPRFVSPEVYRLQDLVFSKDT